MSRIGFVKVHRAIVDSQVFINPELLKVWIWCLVRANFEPSWVPITTGRGTSQVFLEPGQFVFGRHAAAAELRMPATSVERRMKALEKAGNVGIQAGTHFSVVTICNWERYQSRAPQDGQASGQATGTQRAGNGHPTGTEKNVKNSKNVKKHSSCSEPASPASEPTIADPVVLVFPAVGKGPKEFPLTESKVREYLESFPGVDVLTECRKARQWCIDNPSKRKTAGGIPAFLSRWLGSAQNTAGKTATTHTNGGRVHERANAGAYSNVKVLSNAPEPGP